MKLTVKRHQNEETARIYDIRMAWIESLTVSLEGRITAKRVLKQPRLSFRFTVLVSIRKAGAWEES